jgi:hypothetical protein
MARTKNKNAPEIVSDNLPQEVVDVVSSTQNTAAVVGAMEDERDLVNQLLGQAQMADAFGKFSQTVWSSKLAYVKENKLYRSLAGKKAPNGLEFSGTWEEFCGLLGVSDEKANQDIANLRAFGEEALESMSRMGIGYRELRQYRRLPDDDRSELIALAKAGDAEALTDFAESLMAKHLKEKEELHFRATDAEENCEANAQIVATVRAENDQLKQQLAAAKRRIKTMAADEAEKELRKEAASVAFSAEVVLTHDLREVCTTMLDFAEQSGTDYRGYLAGMLRHLELKLLDLRQEFDLPDNANPDDFSWLGKEVLDSIQPE